MHIYLRKAMKFLVIISCLASILMCMGCTDGENIPPSQISSDNPSGNNDSINLTEDLIPVLVYSAEKLTIVDFEQNKYFETATPSASINKTYLWSRGRVADVKSLETLKTIASDGCILYTGDFISSNRMALLDCMPPDSTDYSFASMRIIDVQDDTVVKEIILGDHYSNILSSPDGNMFTIAGGSMCGRIFNADTLEEITQSSDCEFAGFLTPSADRQFFVGQDANQNVCVWRWTDSGAVKVKDYGLSGISAASISANGKYIAYDPMGYPGDFVFEDLSSGEEVNRINYPYQSDWESALSPDGSKFFLSAQEEGGDDFYLFAFDLQNNGLIHKFGPYGNTIPSYLRIEYLPASIRKSWEWISY